MEPIFYEVDLSHRGQHLVDVTMVVPADVAAGARVVVSTWTPGSYVERDYVHHLQGIGGADEDGRALQLVPADTTSWRIPDTLSGSAAVHVEWYANDLTVRTNHVDDHHALLVGAATFPWVEGAEDRRHVVRIRRPDPGRVWSLLPDGLEPDTYVAGDRDHLVDAAFEVGDFPAVEFDVAGVPHRWVHATHAGVVDLDRVARDVTAISEQAVAVFGDGLPMERFTFLCVGSDTAAGAGGLEHRDGAVLMLPALTDATSKGVQRSRSLIAHEYFHAWNVKRLVPAELVEPSLDRPTPTTSLWVAEGWTSHYDELLPTRAGLWTPRELLDRLVEEHHTVRTSPGVTRQPLVDASFHAWTGLYVRDENSVNAGTNYYGHGAVVAACLDLLVRAEDPGGDGLDQVLRLLWSRFGDTGKGYGHHDVVRALCDAAGRDLSEFVATYVESATPPPLPDLLGTVGLRMVAPEQDPPPPRLGVTTDDDDRGIRVTAVLRGGPAWTAGVTGNDRLIAVDDVLVARGELETHLRARNPGDVVELALGREGRLVRARVTLGEPQPRHRIQPLDDPTETQRTAYARWLGHPLGELGA